MIKHFLSSDFHFNHGNIMKYSKRTIWLNDEENAKLSAGENFKVSYESVARMNRGITENINKIVGENDVLWFLGDFCFAWKDYVGTAWNYRKQIKCKNIFACFGNHDEEGYTDFTGKYYPGLEEVFPSIRDIYQVAIGRDGEYFCGNNAYHHGKSLPGMKTNLFLTHYACAVWNGSHKGVLHNYGHSHSSAETGLEAVMPNRRSFDVGIDNAVKLIGEYRPFTLQEVVNRLSKKQGWEMDHHKSSKNRNHQSDEGCAPGGQLTPAVNYTAEGK